MKEFIFAHYKELLFGFSFLVEIIISIIILIKKTKVRDTSVIQSIIRQLPAIIVKAEEIFGAGSGDLKKKFVLDRAKYLFERITGSKLTDDSWIVDDLSTTIEDILKTPTKK